MSDIWPSAELEKTMLSDAQTIEETVRIPCPLLDAACHVKALLRRVRELEAKNARLRAACEPFAHQAKIIDEYDAKAGIKPAEAFMLFRYHGSYTAICIGDCRRAGEALLS